MSQFDQFAATWDAEAMRQERTKVIAKEIVNSLPIQSEWKGLEYGAGSGVLSFMLKDFLRKILMADNSAEMVNVMEQKVRDSNVCNLSPILLDLEKENYSGESLNMIISSMAFHHIHDIPLLISKFYRMLSKGGYVVIVDLYTEDGSFHGHDFDGHKGFDPAELARKFLAAGFVNSSFKECFVMKKKIENGEWRDFPIFLLIVQK